MADHKLLPSSKHCFICGLENPVGLKLRFYEIEPGLIESTYTAPDHFQGYPGVLHGGIIASILDETSGRAFTSAGGEHRFMFTAKLEVIYRRTVPIGKQLKIVGKAGNDRGRSGEGWAGIYDAETGQLLAEGNTILADIPQHMLDEIGEDVQGWRVYPEE